MLTHTFIHLPGVGAKTECSLWKHGVHSWDLFCAKEGKQLPFRQRKWEELRASLAESREQLTHCNPEFFARMLPSRSLWRLFASFRDSAAYLDIETTGLGGPGDYITTAALYDGKEVFYYIHGHNLDRLANDLRKYKLLVTYNGTCFDLPFIRNYFAIPLDHVHIDLRFLLHSLGYKGGLKRCEKQLGLDRDELNGVDGYFAVLLWEEFMTSRNSKALETLLAYNIADAVNLETLMVKAYNMKIEQTPFPELALPLPLAPRIRFRPDTALIARLRDRYCLFTG